MSMYFVDDPTDEKDSCLTGVLTSRRLGECLAGSRAYFHV